MNKQEQQDFNIALDSWLKQTDKHGGFTSPASFKAGWQLGLAFQNDEIEKLHNQIEELKNRGSGS